MSDERVRFLLREIERELYGSGKTVRDFLPPAAASVQHVERSFSAQGLLQALGMPLEGITQIVQGPVSFVLQESDLVRCYSSYEAYKAAERRNGRVQIRIGGRQGGRTAEAAQRLRELGRRGGARPS